jgi:hypothetical protein
MAWKKMFGNNEPEKENQVPNDPEKKVDAKPPEKPISEIIAESLKPLSEGMASMRAELESMKTKPAPKEKPEVASVLEDEDAAFNQRLTPIMAKTLEMEARMARQDVEREYRNLGFGDLWDDNRTEIDNFLDKSALVSQDERGTPVALRGNPDYIRNVADMIIGRVARKGGIRFDGKDKKFFLEDATGDGGGNLNRKRLDTEGLSNKQIEAAKRFGIPISEYKKAAGKLDFVQ